MLEACISPVIIKYKHTSQHRINRSLEIPHKIMQSYTFQRKLYYLLTVKLLTSDHLRNQLTVEPGLGGT